jgi:hypothetical protein
MRSAHFRPIGMRAVRPAPRGDRRRHKLSGTRTSETACTQQVPVKAIFEHAQLIARQAPYSCETPRFNLGRSVSVIGLHWARAPLCRSTVNPIHESHLQFAGAGSANASGRATLGSLAIGPRMITEGATLLG